MPYYLFTEDNEGKLGYSGKEFFSKIRVEGEAEDILGITHIVEAKTLGGAKRKLRALLVKKKGNLSELYRNVRKKSYG